MSLQPEYQKIADSHRTAVHTSSDEDGATFDVVCLCGWRKWEFLHQFGEPTAFSLGAEEGLAHYWSQVDAYKNDHFPEGEQEL